jgi:hypothetical protein
VSRYTERLPTHWIRRIVRITDGHEQLARRCELSYRAIAGIDQKQISFGIERYAVRGLENSSFLTIIRCSRVCEYGPTDNTRIQIGSHELCRLNTVWKHLNRQ